MELCHMHRCGDVEHDQASMDELLARGIKSVPVTIWDDQVVIGFNPTALARLFSLGGAVAVDHAPSSRVRIIAADSGWSGKGRHRDRALACQFVTMPFDTVNFVQGLRGQLTAPTMRAAHDRNVLNDEQGCPLTITPRDLSEACSRYTAGILTHNCFALS